jgi:peptidoglycan/xylan/chitin deacetylase (PgdA/CDA1 family)
MATKRASNTRKRKKSGSGSAVWLLYPLTILIGTAAGVLYYFRVLEPQQRVAVSTAGNVPATVPERTPTPPRQQEREEPAVTIRSKERTDAPSAGNAPAVTPSGPVEALPPTEIERGGGSRPEVSLTFDAGAEWQPVKQILEALSAHDVKATFFLTGEWVGENPKTTRLIAAQGHEIGNHSWDHPAFTKLADNDIRDQLRRTEAKILEIAGRTSRPYFRPPLGDRDPRVRSIVGEEGFLTVYWSLDSRDSVDRGITSEQIRTRVVDQATAGSIILLHCGSRPTAEALPAILTGLKARGLTQVPLSALLRE